MASVANAFAIGEQISSQIHLQLTVNCAASITVANDISEDPLAFDADRGTGPDVGKVQFSVQPAFSVASQCPYKVLIKAPQHLVETGGDKIAFSAAIVKSELGTDITLDNLSVVSMENNQGEGLANSAPTEQPATGLQSYSIKIQSGSISAPPAFVNNTDETAPRAGVYTSMIEFAIQAL
jgi:hypothetical protein